MIRTPFPLIADAYTISSNEFAGAAAKERSVYNMINRIGPADCASADVRLIAQDNRMVLYGLSDFIRNHLLEPITHVDVDEAKAFMATAHAFGGGLPFPEELWQRVVNEYGGYLPIKILALPEGSTFLPGEPPIQVVSEEGFGELAAHIEAVMVGMVSCASARATVCRHWLNYIREHLALSKHNNYFDRLEQTEKDILTAIAQFTIHDFGMRASSCSKESELLGRAHLLVFNGTDTFNAAYQAIKMGAKRPTGTSILALAHRIVQGHITEDEAFTSLLVAAATNHGIASYVADCFNFKNALVKLVKLAQTTGSTIVVRPDSGDYIQNVLDIIKAACDAGLSSQSVTGEHSATTLRFINGDSMTPTKIDTIYGAIQSQRTDYNWMEWGIFGVGGFLRNISNRDIFSSAYKLAAKGNSFEPVCKLSETKAKRSVPGLVALSRQYDDVPSVFIANSVEEALASDYRLAYSPGDTHGYLESFDVLQKRTLEEFDELDASKWCKNGNIDIWSDEIINLQEETARKYRNE